MNKKIREQKDSIQELNRKIDGYENSACWKITSPLRKAHKFYLKNVNNIPLEEEESFDLVQCDSFDELVFPSFENPLVSIIIPAYNNWDYNYKCLKSIFDNTYGVSYEIIFADDCSTDETKNISEYVKNINIVRNKDNLMFLRNCNNAADQARGKYVLFLNNDTQVQQGWLNSLVDLAESDDEIGLVGSKLVYPDGRLQEAGGIIWNDASGWNYGIFNDPDLSEFNYVKEVDYVSGACIMVRKDLWDEIGGFDERFAPAYFEDTDLAFEIRNKGYKVMYQPESVVVHFEGVSHGTDETKGVKKNQVKNRKKFVEKWQDVLDETHFPNGECVFYARDKTRDKKTVVFVNDIVPTYDKDAGSRSVYQYIKFFVDEGFNVKFIPDNFYPQQLYTSILEQMGVEVLYSNYYKNNWKKWVRNNSEFIDYFFLNRPHIAVKYVDFLRSNTDAKLIYYGHDLHYLRHKREYDVTGDERFLREAERFKKIEEELFSKVDKAFYFSDAEVKLLNQDYPDLDAETIPLFIFDEFNDESFNPSERNDLLFLGGFNHNPNVDAMLWFVNEIFPEVLKNIPDVKLYIVGSKPPKEIKNLASDNVIVTGYVTDKELNNYFNKCKLFVCPLRYGAGIKGKIIQSMHSGLPVITTDTGNEGINCKDLLVADNEKSFAKLINQYYNNNDLLNKNSKKIKKYIKKNFSKNEVKEILKEGNIF